MPGVLATPWLAVQRLGFEARNNSDPVALLEPALALPYQCRSNFTA